MPMTMATPMVMEMGIQTEGITPTAVGDDPEAIIPITTITITTGILITTDPTATTIHIGIDPIGRIVRTEVGGPLDTHPGMVGMPGIQVGRIPIIQTMDGHVTPEVITTTATAIIQPVGMVTTPATIIPEDGTTGTTTNPTAIQVDEFIPVGEIPEDGVLGIPIQMEPLTGHVKPSAAIHQADPASIR